jgi:hypothetical protein
MQLYGILVGDFLMAVSSFKRAGLVTFQNSYADFSNTATGTYVDTSGFAWKYIQFNSSGSLVVIRPGIADLLVISGGGTAYTNNSQDSGYNAGGGAGGLLNRPYTLEATTYTVTVGGAGSNSSFGSLATTTAGTNGGVNSGGDQGSNNQPANGFIGWKVYTQSTGAGAGANGASGTPGVGVVSSITGTAVTYGIGGSRNQSTGFTPPTANSGNGGSSASTGTGFANAGASGVVIVRVRTN